MNKFKLSKNKQVEWDFYPGNDLVLDDRFSGLAKEQLLPFAQTKSGTQICFWKQEQTDTLEKAPIVWIDSEAMPNEVVCNNIDELNKLIPYGSSFIKQLIILIKNYETNKELFVSPDSFYRDWVQENHDAAKIIASDYATSNPVKIVSDSLEKYSESFQEWLLNNTISK